MKATQTLAQARSALLAGRVPFTNSHVSRKCRAYAVKSGFTPPEGNRYLLLIGQMIARRPHRCQWILGIHLLFRYMNEKGDGKARLARFRADNATDHGYPGNADWVASSGLSAFCSSTPRATFFLPGVWRWPNDSEGFLQELAAGSSLHRR